jgi:tRNA-modifying protein YgfZ
MADSISAHIFDFRPAAVFRIRGEDALAFLQGQFTQDLKAQAERLCAYGLWLNQKGKVLADSYLLKDGAEWVLVSMTAPASVIQERLEAYIIADDVTLEAETAKWVGCSVIGADAGALLKKHGIQLPAGGEWRPLDGGWLFRGRRSEVEAWEIIYPATERFSARLREAGAQPVGLHEVERLRIRAGIPSVPIDVGPGDLPNEASLEDVAISYSKGCYLGQEVMARLKTMGQVRRRLMVVSSTEEPVPGCPAPLYSLGKKVGEVRSCVSGEGGRGFLGLAMINLLGLDKTQPLSLQPEGVASVRVLSGNNGA